VDFQVVKKKGLLQATKKSGGAAGEGHAYLRNWIWWTGMTMMILGEVCNFAAFGEPSRWSRKRRKTMRMADIEG